MKEGKLSLEPDRTTLYICMPYMRETGFSSSPIRTEPKSPSPADEEVVFRPATLVELREFSPIPSLDDEVLVPDESSNENLDDLAHHLQTTSYDVVV